MTLSIAIKAPEAIILASESRITLAASISSERLPTYYDHALKLYKFNDHNKWVGAVTYGTGQIGSRATYNIMQDVIGSLGDSRLNVEDIANRISTYFMDIWKSSMPQDSEEPDISFLIGGYDEGDIFSKIFKVEIPHYPQPIEAFINQFGIAYGGDTKYVVQLLYGYDDRVPEYVARTLHADPKLVMETFYRITNQIGFSPRIEVMEINDLVNLAKLFIEVTIFAQKHGGRIQTCGGPIDIAIIRKKEGIEYIQCKKI